MTERETQLIKDISRIHNYLSTDGLYTLKWEENIKSRSFDSSSRNKGFLRRKRSLTYPRQHKKCLVLICRSLQCLLGFIMQLCNHQIETRVMRQTHNREFKGLKKFIKNIIVMILQ